jgi:integrase
MRYPADPPTIEEIVTVTRHAGDGVHGRATARADRRAVAGRAADLRCAHARRGRPWDPRRVSRWCGTATAAAAARTELRRVARQAGVRRRSAPHQLRHAHAVEMAREGVPLILWWVE